MWKNVLQLNPNSRRWQISKILKIDSLQLQSELKQLPDKRHSLGWGELDYSFWLLLFRFWGGGTYLSFSLCPDYDNLSLHCKYRAIGNPIYSKCLVPIYVFSENRIIKFCLPISTLMYLWAIYLFPGLVSLFCCSLIGRPILGINRSITHTWMQELVTRPRSFISGNT